MLGWAGRDGVLPLSRFVQRVWHIPEEAAWRPSCVAGWVSGGFRHGENNTERDDREGVLVPLVLGSCMYVARLICPLELVSRNDP